MMRDLFGAALLAAAMGGALLLVGCGPATPGTTTPHPDASASATPTSSASAGPEGFIPPPTGDPFALEGLIREEWLPLLSGPAPTFADVVFPTTPKNVPAPPPNECNAWVTRGQNVKVKRAPCSDKAAALDLLDKAMANADPASRDEQLAIIESCEGFDAGVIRALRIDLGPAECGDAMAEPLLVEKPGAPKPQGKREIPGAIHHTLVGQALAARLLRTVQDPPKLDPPYTKDRVTTFTKGPLFTWFTDQAKAVEELSKMAAELSYYGKGIAAIAAGTADLKLVEAVREAPLPDEFRSNPDALNDYYSNLDQALEPRKTRGRDAALVGMKEMAHAGIIRDERTDIARGLLAKMYGGRRVDGLDVLRVGPDHPLGAGTMNARLAATLPTFFVGALMDPAAATDPAVLENLRERGVPTAFRVALKDAKLDDAAAIHYAHARLRMGLRYWRAVDFDACAALLTKIGHDKLKPEDRLDLGLALALRNGPDDVAVLMLKAGVMPPEFGKVAALDAIALDEKSEGMRGFAAYDGAVITQLTIPRNNDGQAWSAVGKRYAAAIPLITDPALSRDAQSRARAADETAKALSRTKPE